MNKKVHLLIWGPQGRIGAICNKAIKARAHNTTALIKKVTCKNCLKLIASLHLE